MKRFAVLGAILSFAILFAVFGHLFQPVPVAHGQPEKEVAQPPQPAQPSGVRWPNAVIVIPVPPPPQQLTKLNEGELYVVEWDKEFFLLASPNELVKMTKVAGPMTVHATLAGGSGQPETKTFHGKVIYLVSAAGKGMVELLAVPSGVTAEASIVRKNLEVGGGGPRPPPNKNAILEHITFIGSELNPASLAINNDGGLRTWLGERGVSVHVRVANDPAIAAKNMTEFVKLAGGAPCIILQDGDGNVIGQGPMLSVEQIQKLCTPFIKR